MKNWEISSTDFYEANWFSSDFDLDQDELNYVLFNEKKHRVRVGIWNKRYGLSIIFDFSELFATRLLAIRTKTNIFNNYDMLGIASFYWETLRRLQYVIAYKKKEYRIHSQYVKIKIFPSFIYTTCYKAIVKNNFVHVPLNMENNVLLNKTSDPFLRPFEFTNRISTDNRFNTHPFDVWLDQKEVLRTDIATAMTNLLAGPARLAANGVVDGGLKAKSKLSKLEEELFDGNGQIFAKALESMIEQIRDNEYPNENSTIVQWYNTKNSS